nr:flagellar export chaperone FliS [Thermosyntropha lipolytica]
MNMYAQAYDQYKKTSVETLSPGKLLLMLYEGAIKNVKLAREGIKEKDYNKAHNHLIKAQDIITELMVTLKMEYDIAKQLYSIYDYLYRRLVEANVRKDAAILDEVEVFLTELRDTWQEVVKKQAQSLLEKSRPQNISVKG